jgi:acyl-CoA synthetase (AMP-forming)/AMP-acid ligase II
MGNWNFADAWDAAADVLPDAPAQIQGDRVLTWRDFDRRANAFARELQRLGLKPNSKIAILAYNGPEWLEALYGAFKVSMVPVNTNYRYGPAEITYIYDNADAETVVFHATFAPLLDEIRGELPLVKQWFVISDGADEPEWAVNYEDVVGPGADRPDSKRSGDDVHMLYTGGTTGMPKGVVYRQDDLFGALGGGGNAILGIPPATDVDELKARLVAPGAKSLPACPIMHGTGQWSSFQALNAGGCIVTLTSRKFDPAELWRTVTDKQVNVVVIVGDAFAKPMLEELDRNPDAYNLESMLLIGSSGVMWSHEVKQGLLRHKPSLILYDSLGSTEAVGMAGSAATGETNPETAKFQLGEHVKVFTDDDRAVEPGSGEIGRLAVGGFLPLEYYKDPEKSARTFRTIDGHRYSLPGDYATVDADGTIHLLGRGTVCINSGGEKIFPEEVEEVLKQHEAIRDAVCVGVPDDRFGEAVTAIVEPQAEATIDEADVIDHVKSRIAAYKAPRHIVVVPTIGRSPAGKVDYAGLRTKAIEDLGLQVGAG